MSEFRRRLLMSKKDEPELAWIDAVVLCHVIGNNSRSGDGLGMSSTTTGNDRAFGFIRQSDLALLNLGPVCSWGTENIFSNEPHDRYLESIYSVIPIPKGVKSVSCRVDSRVDYSLFIRDAYSSVDVNDYNVSGGWVTGTSDIRTYSIPSAYVGSKQYWIFLNTRSNGEYSSIPVGTDVSNIANFRIRFNNETV